MKRRIGILLAGCGAVDGTDPQEAILLQLAVQERGHEAIFIALDRPQFHVSDHTTTCEMPGESRNQFQESQRIVRGKLYSVNEISPKMLDIIIIPGGQGPIKSWLLGFVPGEKRRLVPELMDFLTAFRQAGGILGVLSLAEFISTAFEGEWPEDRGALDLNPEDVLLDPEKGRALCPGNLTATNLPQLRQGINRLLDQLLELWSLRHPT